MRKALFIIAVAIIAVIVSGFILTKNMKADQIRINSKDLSEEGLIIIKPSDPEFDQELSTITKDSRAELRDALEANKPLCVILKNTGKHDAVLYALKWEFIKADGTVMPYTIFRGSPGAFEKTTRTAEEEELMNSGYQVRAHSSRLISLDSALSDFIYAIVNDRRGNNLDALYKALSDYLARPNKGLARLLDSTTSVTVSLDGAFFDDGTFVGPDTTNFFANVEAEFAAQRDVSEMVIQGVSEKRNSAEIAKQIEEIAKEPKLKRYDDPALNDHYNQFAKTYANDLLRVKEISGFGYMIEHNNRNHNASLPVLHKKDSAK